MKQFNKFFMAVLLCLAGTIAFAQAPQGVNYQAVARDGSGAIMANENANVIFTIREAAATGADIYSETHTTTTNNYGLFNLIIGDGSSTLGAFSSIDWASDEYFLNVEVNGNDMGTTQLLSVPYAIHAETANTAEELEDPIWVEGIAGAHYTEANVGIGQLANGAADLGITSDLSSTSYTIDIEATNGAGGDDVIQISSPGTDGSDSYQFIEADNDDGIVWSVESDGSMKCEAETTDPNPNQIYGNALPSAYGYIGSTPTILTDYGIQSVVRTSTGVYEIKLDNYPASVAPVVMVTTLNYSVDNETATYSTNSATETIIVRIANSSGTARDSDFSIVVFGW